MHDKKWDNRRFIIVTDDIEINFGYRIRKDR